MGKQIKLVWILTIVTALLVIGGQVYWLYQQYTYTALAYMARLNDTLLVLQDKNFTLALDANHAIKMVDANRATKDSDLVKLGYSLKMNFEEGKAESYVRFSKLYDADSLGNLHLVDSFNVTGLSLDEVVNASLHYTKYADRPFDLQALDSLFTSHHIHATDWQLVKLDSFLWQGTYVVEKSCMRYRMKFIYPYNPFVRDAVTGYVDLPTNPLLKEMGWQLVGSLILILLLIFCLIYQVRTILKQYKLDELRKGFVNTMIHELKRPVQTLKMCVAFLNNKRMRKDEQMMDEVVKDSMFELDNLSAYLVKVREMTRADDEQTPLSVRLFNLSETLEKLLRLTVIPADKHVRFETRLTPNPLWVTADSVHLTNSISNLVENAIKYSGNEVCIRISASLAEGKLVIRVADNGFGISSQDQLHIFDKFYRSEQMVGRGLPGIGLGLSYVKLMVEAHGGTVGVESILGRGSVFTLEIPQSK
ncbi:MAG TPA: HAMP domain-containing histidine kinase [Bacteroides mediterraneensis]|uniref:sensor histidine kinase n=1 Tax=Bacteroides mediterraneensis TaxID=1841856 RepID=UPI00260E4F77|nr:HAMP domain-containing sensor histidine kinase [Bacteroides mediterraneensis]HJH65994.1 HAMP domain-containing histidine kinase [Bacteroides mediterraneensis]